MHRPSIRQHQPLILLHLAQKYQPLILLHRPQMHLSPRHYRQQT
jgi:hypothetical protein